jgi:hypothetical protein
MKSITGVTESERITKIEALKVQMPLAEYALTWRKASVKERKPQSKR